jgi:MoxR-like ATPase
MSNKEKIVELINGGITNIEIAKIVGVKPSLVRKYRSLKSKGLISLRGSSAPKKAVKTTKKSEKVAKKVSKPRVKKVKSSKVVGFIDPQKVVPNIEAGLELGYNIAIRGKTSTAKTFLVTELAKKYSKTLNYFNANVNSSVDEVKGKYILKYDSSGKPKPEWVDSSIVKAMRNGDWLVIEEINFLSEDLLSVFYSILDSRKDLILDEKDGEVVKAHPDFRVFATMNWSYRGTNELNDALKRRFQLWIDLDYLPKKNEKSLILSKVEKAKDSDVNALVEYADSYRKNKTRNKTDLGTDTLIKCAELSTKIPLKQALEVTIIPILAYDDEEKRVIREQFNLLLRSEEVKDTYKVGDIVSVKEYGKISYIFVLAVNEKGVHFIQHEKKTELVEITKQGNLTPTILPFETFHSKIMESNKEEKSDKNE